MAIATSIFNRSAAVFAVSAFIVIAQAQPTWKCVFGGYAVDEARDIAALGDGGFVVVGSTGSFGNGSSDIYLFKVNATGIREWSALLGGPEIDEAQAIVEMADGGFVIVGSTNGGGLGGYDGLVIRTDPNGSVLWERTFGGADWDFLNTVDRDGSDGIWAGGITYSSGVGGDHWLVHLDSEGEALITRTYGGLGAEETESLKSTPDGGCVLAGVHTTVLGDMNAHVLKVNSAAEIEWEGSYGGDSLDLARDIIRTSDGGYSILGSTRSFNPVVEQYHVKLASTGIEEWVKHWGQVNDQEGYEHVQLSSGEFASIGYVSQGGAGGKDMFLLKSDSQGNFILGQTQGGSQDEFGYALVRAEGGYVMCGVTLSYGAGQWDVMVIRTNEVGFTTSDFVNEQFDPVSVEELGMDRSFVYPNPSSGSFTVPDVKDLTSWRLIDSSGRISDEGKLTNGFREVECTSPSGFYLLELFTRNGIVERGQLIIARP